jgi:hypothetical protein
MMLSPSPVVVSDRRAQEPQSRFVRLEKRLDYNVVLFIYHAAIRLQIFDDLMGAEGLSMLSPLGRYASRLAVQSSDASPHDS